MNKIIAALVLAFFAVPARAQQPVTAAARAEIRKAVEHTAADPSQRSTIATPSIDFTAELAKDKKTATAKAGFALGEAFTAEAGFTGAFSEDDDRSAIASVRGLGTGSKGWVGLTYKKFRLTADLARMGLICWQNAWASGDGLFDKATNCQESTLSDESFAERIANATPRAGVRAVCQRFNRVLTAAPTAQPVVDCDAPNVQDVLKSEIDKLGERGSVSYRARAGAAGASILDLCNEYRRTIGAPPTGEVCKVADLPDRSWREQFGAAVSASSIDQVKIEICNQYRAARGLAPAETGDCATTAGSDPLFTQSFHDRYAAAYHWGVTPIVAVRYEENHSKFSYLDGTLTLQEPTHNSGAFLADVGFLTSGGVLVTAGYRYADIWRAKPAVSLCRPVAGTDATKCAQAILGAPAEKMTHSLEVQAKRFLTATVAAQIVATIDQDHAWEIDVPLYFIPDKDSKGLTGGIVASYHSESRWNVSVFVGQRFTLFN